MSKVRVLYDFAAEQANELNTITGEELTVVNPNQFEGWMELRNSRGVQGMVPSSYVEFINSNDSDDDIPPPPSNSTYGFSPNNPPVPSWSMPAPASTYVNSNTSYVNQYPSQTNEQTFNFDNFDTNLAPGFSNTNFETQDGVFSDFVGLETKQTPALPSTEPAGESTFNSTNTSASIKPAYSSQPAPTSKSNRSYEDDDSDGFSDDESTANTNVSRMNNSTSFASATNRSNSINLEPLSTNNAGSLTRHKSKNSYGLEVFLLHGAVKSVPDCDRFSSIILNELRQSVWKRQSPPYEVNIVGYHSDKKYHGVKKFTSYEIQAKIFPQKVKRRYNHFDWLHERLVEKYPNICIPPLPGKAVTGNFEDEFISKRKAQLELWLNRMSHHPVVGQSEVFIHFLQCDDASSKWKAGKRKAEKEEYRGAQWFCTLTVPGESVDTTLAIKERVDKFSKAAYNLDNCVKNVGSTLEKIGTLNSSTFKKEYAGLGKRLEDLGLSLNNDSLDAPNNSALANALFTAGNTYTQIGNMYGEQAKTDISPLLDCFQLYRGLIQQMPDIVQFEKNAIQTFEDFQTRPEKLEGKNLMEVAPRREIISHVTFAEINLFNRDKVDDLSQSMKTFLQQQITFYTEITECLKRAYANFEKIPVSSSTYSPNSFNSSNRR